MEKVRQVIADSGGSNTTWICLNSDGSFDQLRTESLHPRNLKLMSDNEVAQLKLRLATWLEYDLTFYGAGCGNSVAVETTRHFLKQLGFNTYTVLPDTLGACRALFGNNVGNVAILGTGSVLVSYNGNEIVDRSGGYGPLLGDEGSGFHFGKLLVRNALDTFPNWSTDYYTLFGSVNEVREHLAQPNSINWISNLGLRSMEMDFDWIHEKNFDLFVESIASKEVKTLGVIGSYAFSKRLILEKCLNRKGIELIEIDKDPCSGLIRFHSL